MFHPWVWGKFCDLVSEQEGAEVSLASLLKAEPRPLEPAPEPRPCEAAP